MKPMKLEYHNYLADWVKKGGILIYCGEDIDPYQTVLEWWNTDGNEYKAPSEHLFEKMNLSRNPGEGTYRYGKGTVIVMREDPKHFVLKAGNDQKYFETIASAYQKKIGKEIETKNRLHCRTWSIYHCCCHGRKRFQRATDVIRIIYRPV